MSDLTDTIESVNNSGKLFAKLEPRYKKFAAALRQAVDQGSLAKIGLYRPEFEKVMGELDNCMHGVRGSLALVGFLRKDKALMASKFDTIEKLTNKVADYETKLAAWREAGTDLDKAALAALDELETGQTEMVGELSEMKDRFNDTKKALEYMEKEGKKLEDQTRKAQAAGDAKGMSAARVKFLDLGYTPYETGAVKLTIDVKKFLAKAKDRDHRNEAQWMLDELPDLIQRFKTLGNTGRELALAKIAAVPPKAPPQPPKKPPAFNAAQVAKIGDTIGVPQALRPKLVKAVNNCPRSEWPREIAKACGLKEADVKAKMPLVNKLPFIGPLDLIDI